MHYNGIIMNKSSLRDLIIGFACQLRKGRILLIVGDSDSRPHRRMANPNSELIRYQELEVVVIGIESFPPLKLHKE